MKLLLCTMMLLFIITNLQAQNEMLRSANRAVFNSISPVERTGTSTAPIVNNNNSFIYNFNTPTTVIDVTDVVMIYKTYDYSHLIKPNQGIINNPNQDLFKKNTINSLNNVEIFNTYNQRSKRQGNN